MSLCEHIGFPELVIIDDKELMLSLQLICWGNIHLGCEPPDDFVEWLDKASLITGAYTSFECMRLSDEIITTRARDRKRGIIT